MAFSASNSKVGCPKPDRKGAATVEAALIFPVIVLICMGFCELGWMVNCSQQLDNAARQGARAAVYLENSNAEVTAVVKQAVTDSLKLEADEVSVRIVCLNDDGSESYDVQNLNENEMGKPIKVIVSSRYTDIGITPNWLGFSNMIFSGSSVARRRK